MRQIIEQDLCVGCAHLEPTKSLPKGQFEIVCGCVEDFPFTKVNHTANAISECPMFVMVRITGESLRI